MASVRILVDGYSLLHHWLDLAPGKPRQSDAAREELIGRLTQYYDATDTPITVVFDGARPIGEVDGSPSTFEVEIVFCRAGQTAGQLLMRLTHRFRAFGEVLVVSDNLAERAAVEAGGGLVSSCADFARTVQITLDELKSVLKTHNQMENSKFLRQT